MPQTAERARPVGRYVVARVEDIPDGGRVIVDVEGRSVGVFNVEGRFFAMLNRCPHKGAELCKGDVIDEVASERPGDVRLERGRKFLTCPWHGWEYDIETGQSWYQPHHGRARAFAAAVEDGETVAAELEAGASGRPSSGQVVDPATHRVKGPYTADMLPVAVEDEYVVITLRAQRGAKEVER